MTTREYIESNPRLVLCPVCRRLVRTCYPTGDALDSEILWRHNDRDGNPCDGSRQEYQDPEEDEIE